MTIEKVREISKAWHPGTDEPSPAEALKKLKELFNAGLITAEEFQAKRRKHIDRL